MSETQIDIAALRAHANTGWDENCLLPKKIVRLIADELQAARTVASDAAPIGEAGGVVAEPAAEVTNYRDVDGDLVVSVIFRGKSPPAGTLLFAVQPQAAPSTQPTDARIRAIFLANGFTIKEGQSDLKPYVFAAAHALLDEARGAQAAPSEPLSPDLIRRLAIESGFTADGMGLTPIIFAADMTHLVDITEKLATFAALVRYRTKAAPSELSSHAPDLSALGEYWHMERERDESDEGYVSRINARKDDFKAWLKVKYKSQDVIAAASTTDVYAYRRSSSTGRSYLSEQDRKDTSENLIKKTDELRSMVEALAVDAERWRTLEAEAYECVVPNGGKIRGSRTAWITKLHVGPNFADAVDFDRRAAARTPATDKVEAAGSEG